MAGPWLTHSRGTGFGVSVVGMSEHDQNPNDPVDQSAPPAPAAKARWRDRVFRMRSVAAVAVAGLIIGAAGGAVTTALVSGDHRGHDHHQPGRMMQPGMMPGVPPDGRMRFPGDGSDDDGSDEPSSLSRS